MPTDAELRTLFHDAAAPRASLDAAAIIRHSKRRRLPQQLGAGSVLTLAVAGIGVASINGLQGLAPMSASETAADAPMGESWVGADGAVPWSTRLSECSTPAPATEAAHSALSVSVEIPDGRAGDTIAGSVLLTNSSADPFSGWVTPPIVYVIADGIAVAHNGAEASSAMRIELAPGESRSLIAAVDTVHCEHDASAGADSPLEPGQYEVVATVTITSDPDGPAAISSNTDGPATISSEPTTVSLN